MGSTKPKCIHLQSQKLTFLAFISQEPHELKFTWTCTNGNRQLDKPGSFGHQQREG
jgi:hypothetical protein